MPQACFTNEFAVDPTSCLEDCLRQAAAFPPHHSYHSYIPPPGLVHFPYRTRTFPLQYSYISPALLLHSPTILVHFPNSTRTFPLQYSYISPTALAHAHCFHWVYESPPRIRVETKMRFQIFAKSEN